MCAVSACGPHTLPVVYDIQLYYIVQLVEAVHNVKELVERQRRPPTPPPEEEEGIKM